jgi:thiol:disulfide interchange protein DsbC
MSGLTFPFTTQGSIMGRHLILSVAILVLTTFTVFAKAENNRWYTDEQVVQGKQLFAANCASCHGKNAESVPDWRKRDANGNYVPPPLNGTAHAWHPSLKILRQTIRKGGKPVGGVMPAVEDKLSDDQIDAIIAWFQSLWTDEIYSLWMQRTQSSGFIPVSKDKPVVNPITSLLKQQLNGVEIGNPEPTPLANIHQAKVGPDYAYLSSDGRYALIGELIDLKAGTNLTEQSKSRDRIKLIESFEQSQMTVFPAKGKTTGILTILTDTDCPFCQKLHKELPSLQAAGITVRYIPFPRGGNRGKGYADLKSVWCAEDRRTAMDIAKGVVPGKLGPGDCEAATAVDQGYKLGIEIGVRGTPAIIMQNGQIIEGYLPAARLIQLARDNTSY